MKSYAVVLSRHGGPEVLEQTSIDVPAPGPREVRVRVRAVALNRMDIWVRKGMPHLRLEYPFRLGCDIAGVVDELGPGAKAPASGQRVLVHPGVACGVCAACAQGKDNLCKDYKILGENTQGGYGQLLNVPDVNILPFPENLSFAEAAALPLCTLTAWQAMFRKAQVQPQQTVLIHSAGSGVSSIAIQLCKIVGARVITTVGSREKVSAARSLGADEVIVNTEEDFVEATKKMTSKRGADLVLDHVGGAVFEKSLRAVAWGGRIVTVGSTASPMASIDLRQVFFRQVEILGSTMGSRGDLMSAIPLIESGKIRPIVDRILPLSEAANAHIALESRNVFGKVVLEVAE